MYSFKKSVIALIGVIVVSGVCAVAMPSLVYTLSKNSSSMAPAPSTQNVKVVNTGLEPVPVQGNVGITGTPAVKIDSATPVMVRDADSPTVQPFYDKAQGTFANGALSTGTIPFSPVPSGKILVVEYVSMNANMLPGQKPIRAELVLFPESGGATAFFLPIQFSGSDGSRDLWVTSEQVRLYVTAGTLVGAFAERDNAVGANSVVNASISGHYEDLR